MDFQLSEQQHELQAAARKFARAEMPAIADMCEEKKSIINLSLRIAQLGLVND